MGRGKDFIARIQGDAVQDRLERLGGVPYEGDFIGTAPEKARQGLLHGTLATWSLPF